jgi:hypothetical protein
LFGIRAGDMFGQIDDNRDGYFRVTLPAQIIESGTIVQLEATFPDGSREFYVAEMPTPEQWAKLAARIYELGGVVKVVAVAVVIVERGKGQGE